MKRPNFASLNHASRASFAAGDSESAAGAAGVCAIMAESKVRKPSAQSAAKQNRDAGVFIFVERRCYRQSLEPQMDILGKRMVILGPAPAGELDGIGRRSRARTASKNARLALRHADRFSPAHVFFAQEISRL